MRRLDISLIFLALGVITGLLALFHGVAQVDMEPSRKECNVYGYPNARFQGGEIYCVRPLRGGNEVVRLEALRGKWLEKPRSRSIYRRVRRSFTNV